MPPAAALADGAAVYRAAWLEGIAPESDLTVSEWADRYRLLTTATSAEPGRWRTDRTPYLRELMDALSARSPVTDVVLMKGAQVGGTEAGNNWIGYVISHAPGPMMAVWPTSLAARRASRQRLTPLIEECEVLRDRVAEPRSRDGGNTAAMKEFPGGALVIAGANSAVELRSMPARYLFLDEVDAYPSDLDDEGDPVLLAVRRTATFARSKRLYVSTPTIKGVSRIERLWLESDQRHYQVPCPHCGTYQPLVWEQLRWRTDETRAVTCRSCGVVSDGITGAIEACPECDAPIAPNDVRVTPGAEVLGVWYECASCEGRIDEGAKTEFLAAGRWVPEQPGEGRPRGYHLSALYSPLGWYSWRQAVSDYLASEHDSDARKAWHNTVLGLPYEDPGDRPDDLALRERAEPYPLGTVPEGGLLVTAGVDVQGDRLEALLVAWGVGEEAWIVDWQQLYGDPARPDVWQSLDDLLTRPLRHEFGCTVQVSAAAIDSGYATHDVYDYCRRRARRHVLAVKGVSREGRPILGRPSAQDVARTGRTVKRGVRLWPVGVDTAKSVVYARLNATPPGPATVHFPDALPDEFYQQLTAERLVTRYVRGFPRREWRKDPGARNEALDCYVYAYAAAIYAGVKRMNWQQAAERLKARAGDLFEQAPPAARPDVDGETRQHGSSDDQQASRRRPALRRTRAGWVKGWRS